MRTLKLLSITGLLFITSCYSFNEIGEVNMISHRNIDNSKKYVLLQPYVGSSDEEMEKSRAKTIEDAIDQTVQKVPGGEYLMNVRIYEVIRGNGGNGKKWFAVNGDVWGIKQEEAVQNNINQNSAYAFKVNDKVTWKHWGKWYTGVIYAIKDLNSCLVKLDNGGSLIELKYKDLSKIDSNDKKTQ